MNDEKTKLNYDNFDQGMSTVSTLKTSMDENITTINGYKESLVSDDVFMGPIANSCGETFDTLVKAINVGKENYDTIESYLKNCKENYLNADDNAKTLFLAIKNGKVVETDSPGLLMSRKKAFTETIPDSLRQRGYTVTCYGKEGWWFSGTNLKGIARGSRQESVHNVWKKDGARYKNGIAVMNVDGQDCYLVATAASLGKVGDVINVTLKNGQQVPCVIADAKSSSDWNYTKYGHSGAGGVNVLEFEVDRHKYLKSGNPTTKSWGLDWDSSSGVKKVDNYGSII